MSTAESLFMAKAKLQASIGSCVSPSPSDDEREDTILLSIKRQNQLKRRVRELMGFKPEWGIVWEQQEHSYSTESTAPSSANTSVKAEQLMAIKKTMGR
ncbi:unnamed protein product [Vitrella brassicaformis CCMP3155]|uniref:Uncharacterized protein n=1 Tax=Vitrella brassicaformis (strain CCMP3155) TaxID=1169540 RepID=A0A0G4FKZ8_VITBC|nr:unnamed protein product [Vitrella brassicaformis CCMP3155]|mmetsp:Transcript_48984/g.122775  ORF Transcript_48984/g.122775 Transcript_48984/m.122775 type:complete len:99 (+) Transcript_48984:172-468(+)|eukprot:CEM14571.1 unnamed protein product [Vitrella brassicaformis CCMP3155]